MASSTNRDRPTTTKSRIFAGDSQLVRQQIVRVDVIYDSDLSDICKEQMLAYLNQTIPTVDALILSDYETGVISPEIIKTAIPLAREAGKIVTVDAHGDLGRFQGVTALTPNQPEAETTLGMRIHDRASLEIAGEELLERTHAEGLLITRGSEGMSLFERDQPPLHLPVFYHGEVADPTGAGDTVAATFTLALTAGATQAEAATLANIAAGLVIQRLGNATNTPEELMAAVRAQVEALSPVLAREQLVERLVAARAHGDRIVLTNGVFDLLHLGHLRYLERARSLGMCWWSASTATNPPGA